MYIYTANLISSFIYFDVLADHEVTTNICLDASGNQCKPWSSGDSLNASTNTTNSSNEINNYNKAFCIKQPDHMPSSSFTCTALSSTVTV